jgi:hypothetical protein
MTCVQTPTTAHIQCTVCSTTLPKLLKPIGCELRGRFAFRNGWNTYGNVNQCGRRCGDTCCPGQQGYAEELSSVPLAFEIMPKMLKRAGCKKIARSYHASVIVSYIWGLCLTVDTTARNRCYTHAWKVA